MQARNVYLSVLLLFFGITFASRVVAAESQVQTPARYVFVIQEISADSSHHIIEQSIASQYTDPKLALLENNIPLYPEDKLDRYMAIMTVGGIIRIERAPVIHLKDGKKRRDIRSWKSTLIEALADNQVPEIGKDDRVVPDLGTSVSNNSDVVITRVAKTTVIKKEVIEFQTLEKDDPTLERGKTKVTKSGHRGEKQYTYEVTREDGEEKSRVLKKTEITTAKEDKVVVKGTKLIFGRHMSGKASWYKSAYKAASHVLPRGTKVLVTNPLTGKSLETVIEDYMENATYAIDLHPDIFKQLGATLGQGLQDVVVKEVLN